MMHSSQPAYIKGTAIERVAKAKQFSLLPSQLPFLAFTAVAEIYHLMTLH